MKVESILGTLTKEQLLKLYNASDEYRTYKRAILMTVVGIGFIIIIYAVCFKDNRFKVIGGFIPSSNYFVALLFWYPFIKKKFTNSSFKTKSVEYRQCFQFERKYYLIIISVVLPLVINDSIENIIMVIFSYIISMVGVSNIFNSYYEEELQKEMKIRSEML